MGHIVEMRNIMVISSGYTGICAAIVVNLQIMVA